MDMFVSLDSWWQVNLSACVSHIYMSPPKVQICLCLSEIICEVEHKEVLLDNGHSALHNVKDVFGEGVSQQ